MVPIFGGRLWTTFTTASLLIPCIGIGFAVQNPETPYLIFLVLALLCGGYIQRHSQGLMKVPANSSRPFCQAICSAPPQSVP